MSAHDEAWVLNNVVEPKRKRIRLSIRQAARQAGLSESTWRQLVAGGVPAAGNWVPRTARRDQVLVMAKVVDALEEAAKELGATPDEVNEAERQVLIHDPAEDEIMNARHLSNAEKLRLIETLQALRSKG